MTGRKRAAILGLSVALGGASPARAEDRDVAAPPAPAAATRGPLFHPDGPGPYKLRVGVGALVDVLPARVVQSEQRQVPQLTAEARFGLPYGFSLDARLSAIVISNEVSAGAAWSHAFGHFSFSVQDRQAVWYGYLGTSGFDATGWGYMNRPGLAVGASWGSERLSLTGELILTFAEYAKLGDSRVVSRNGTTLAGATLTLVLESMLDAGGILYAGVGVLRTTVDYQAWIAFSDQRARLLYPRFLAGYVF